MNKALTGLLYKKCAQTVEAIFEILFEEKHTGGK